VSEERLRSAKIQGVVLVIMFVERKEALRHSGQSRGVWCGFRQREKGCFDGWVEFGVGEGETKKRL